MMNCNHETGACELPSAGSVPAPQAHSVGTTVRYVGDPMCSWCWGLSPELRKVAEHCAQQGIGFTVTMGGLRAGGGDPWVSGFKTFLRNEWQHIAATTGQPFGYTLLDKPEFDYDTEPACRAVAVAQLLGRRAGNASVSALPFLAAVQHKFYVEGADPKHLSFYKNVCEETGLNFSDFAGAFVSHEGRQAVAAHFAQSRHWGVRAFPTLLLDLRGRCIPIMSGYAKAPEIIARISHHLLSHSSE